MISRSVVVMLGMLSAMLPPTAFAQSCSDPVPFRRLLEYDAPGGYYYMGEDAEISRLFRDGSPIAADFKTVKPHRTKEFGSGVAFWFCDAREQRVVRVAFGDLEGEDTVRLTVFNFIVDDKPDGKPNIVLKQPLSLAKARAGRVKFQKGATGRLMIEVDEQTFSIDPGFEMQGVLVQIYCADGWARFVEGDLVS